jgi:hypothetical protein
MLDGQEADTHLSGVAPQMHPLLKDLQFAELELIDLAHPIFQPGPD